MWSGVAIPFLWSPQKPGACSWAMTTQTPPPGSRPLSTPVVVLASVALLAVCLVLARFAHGSWPRALGATAAPGIFACGLLVFWIIERRRGRPLFSRAGTIVFLALLGAAAGLSATLLLPRLGPVWAGAVPGVFYGTLMGIAWSRRPRPDNSSG